MQAPKVFPIKKDEIAQAVETLFQAFANDPLMQWIFGSPDLYQQKGHAILATWVRYAVMYGVSYRTENFESVAIRKKPGDVKTSFWRLLRTGMLKTPGILQNDPAFKRLMCLDELSTKTKLAVMEDEPFLYCWLIGTKPQFQGQGFGSTLMQQTFLDAKEVVCYLEVASRDSQQVHAKRGYVNKTKFTLPESDVTIAVMVRNPSV